MLYLYEVEIFKDGDFYIAVPFDFEGATEGFSKQECLEMAADGISQGRVTQLVKSGKLETFSYQGREYVTKASVDARKEYNDFNDERPNDGNNLVQPENYQIANNYQISYSNVIKFCVKENLNTVQNYETREYM